MNIAIIGGGMAACHTAIELRARGADGEITILSAEPYAPYDRPPLSKELLTRTEPVPLVEASGADLSSIEATFLAGQRATGLTQNLDGTWLISTAASHMPSDQPPADQIHADQVVLATGLLPRNPWPEAFTLKSFDDATRLRAALATLSSLSPVSGTKKANVGSVVVIGAGWIGAELAWHLHSHGWPVVVLEAGPSPLWRQLGRVGELTRPWYREAGIELHTGVQVLDVLRADAGLIVRTDAGDFDAVIVVSAIGAQPDVAWLQDSFTQATDILAPTGHVRVDENFSTAIPGLWAVGDIVAHPVGVGGHWFDAMRDPALLAAAMMGEPQAPKFPAELFSEQFGRRIVGFGAYTGAASPTALQEQSQAQPPSPQPVQLSVEEPEDGGFIAQYRTGDGTLLGAVVCDQPRAAIAIRKELRKEMRKPKP